MSNADRAHPMDAGAGPEPGPGAVQELGHVVLYVTDLERSVEFYESVLGWHRIEIPGRMRAAAFSGGRTHHELLLIEVGRDAEPIPSGRRVGMYHLGLKVGDSDDELRAALDRVRARPDLAAVLGASDHGITHSLYISDPDGNEVELYIDVVGVDWRADPGLVAAPVRPLRL